MNNKLLLPILLLFVVPILCSAQNKIDLLILNKQYNTALTEIANQLSQSSNAELFQKQGMIYKSQQNYQKAIQSFTQGLQYKPNNVDLLSDAAECFTILGNNHDAISFYSKAVQLAPTDLSIAAKLGRVYINLKEHKKAYEVFSGIYSQDSSNVYWNKQLAYCSFRVFKREQARDLYKKVIEANPRDHGSYTNLIHCYNWKKEGAEIMATIDTGLVIFPNDPELLLERAMFLYRTKRYGPAMVNFENYLKYEEEPSYEILMNIGISTYFAGKIEKAFDRFSMLQIQNPNDPLVLYYKSLCYKKQKNFPDSEKYMQWAIESSTPDYVSEMYHHLGQIYGMQRKFKESIAALEKSYELNPEKHEVLFEIATTFEEYNSNKTLALNYYKIYLTEAGEAAKNVTYALERIDRLKEDLFFEE